MLLRILEVNCSFCALDDDVMNDAWDVLFFFFRLPVVSCCLLIYCVVMDYSRIAIRVSPYTRRKSIMSRYIDIYIYLIHKDIRPS